MEVIVITPQIYADNFQRNISAYSCFGVGFAGVVFSKRSAVGIFLSSNIAYICIIN
jgi:hypothetical protein